MKPLRWCVDSIQAKGVIQTAKIAASASIDLLFDWKYGTDTMRWVRADAIATGSGNRGRSVHYQATKARPLAELLRDLGLPTDSVFVDIGSGKGRVLLVASHHGFRKVVGVEFSGALCDLARKNIEIFSKKTSLQSPIEIIELDAIHYRFHGDERVLFMYNPFDAEVLNQVLENLRGSLETNPRKIWLIYNTPIHHEVVNQCGVFRSDSAFEIGGNRFRVYEN